MAKKNRVNIHEAKTHFSKLIESAEKGDEIIIMRAGKPVAKLVSIEEGSRAPGKFKGKITISDDFDEPLDPESFKPHSAKKKKAS